MLWTRTEWSKRQWLRVLVVGVLALVYGCTDEYHQSFVEGRDSSVLDLVADLTGGLIGGAVYVVRTAVVHFAVVHALQMVPDRTVPCPAFSEPDPCPADGDAG